MTDSTDAPDSDAESHDSITVSDTPQRDNPKFGSVSVSFQKGLHGSTIRMTRKDAQKLNALLKDYLNMITATGYQKPRTITTHEDLHTLDRGVIIRSSSGEIWERFTNSWDNLSESGDRLYSTSGIVLPAVVLWEAGADE